MTEAPPEGRPRLLVLTSTYPRWKGDPEPGFVHELSRRLASSFDVTVLAPHAAGASVEETLDGVHVQRFRYAPVRWETLVNDGGIVANLKRHPVKYLLLPFFFLGQALAAWRLVRRWRPQVAHAHWLVPQGFLAGLLRRFAGGPPFLVTSHGADLYALRSAPLPAIKRWVAREATGLTVVSHAMKDELARIGIDPARAQVQSMGVDLKGGFTPDPDCARDEESLLFVGRLVEKKGLRHLIDAMPLMLAQRPALTLRVAGFGPEEPALRAQVAALELAGNVQFLGAMPQAELPALYRRATLFVAPFVEAASGDQEGLGLVMIEAAGCGCPVIASDLPAVRDVLEERVAPGDAAALAEGILGFLEQDVDARRRKAEILRQRLLHRFDWHHVADGYADALTRAMTAGAR
ncbi:glycosyltransferase [Arenimonas sp.]|uniref:glycosyltransferase n=1 Tax=Arenimonas sp. TaxID=1872635 RepID=UPI0039E42ED6